MAWDFETDPEYQRKLDWVAEFVRTEVEPLDLIGLNPYNRTDPQVRALLRPLQEQVKEQGLWACHLGPELGGPGYGQLKLALLNEVLGTSMWAPLVFGCQAPDSGNAEILAHFGTAEQKAKYLQPLLDGEIGSCYVMTEPTGGSDPTSFRTTAVRDGEHWVINGEKWFNTAAEFATFHIVMAVTDPDAPPHQRLSMFIVPADTPGLEIVKNFHVHGFSEHEAHLRFTDVRIPVDHLLGAEGQGFIVAQTRLGGGRVHHAMRTVALVRKAFDMMCERAVSRPMGNGVLGGKQMTQERIADSWIEMEQFRLLVLRTAWRIDKEQNYLRVRKDIAAIKVAMPKVMHDIARRALHLHGALGVSEDLPFVDMLNYAEVMAIADGPTEVHKITLAKEVLKQYAPADPVYPSGYRPVLREQARELVARRLEHAVGNL
ncbi:acyl-CoA dehydrogenase family protein [Nocardia sp. CDC159]|uniref:Acyl-CoA dehydrogenase family protein n=1 Tax=Nocardia pulmonis TaxID=2951408 RepID=A0A9X2E1P2_9NOCA|nr:MULTISPECIES: acyl-CoA dehydrogenase family protein [Nocardia]MCM6772219.1 acyl-CoA dehydrogenase family protein [Nocardia pulmonis]MCM6785123.1 acyl-CoA dehydrogenase family protein [Nocardia sp. CDC159]